MVVVIVLRNRNTHTMRKLKETYAEFDMMHISELLRKADADEAIIEVYVNADAFL